MTENNEIKQNRMSKKQKLLRACLSILIISAILLPSAYALKIFSSRAKLKTTVNTGTLGSENDDFFSFEKVIADGQALSFKNPGDSIDYTATVTNIAKANMHYYFGINYKATDNTNTNVAYATASAILVYFDGEFIGTLAGICSSGNAYIDRNSFLIPGSSASSETHTISFKLHISAPQEYLNNSLTVDISAYSQSADYEKYIFVKDENEFKKAIDDINSGMLPSPVTVVLTNDIILTNSYSVQYPCTFDLFGNQLAFSDSASLELNQNGTVFIASSKTAQWTEIPNGEKIILNSGNASLNIDDIYDENGNNVGQNYYSELVSVKDFDMNTMTELLTERFNASIKNGILNNSSATPFGALKFILPSVSINSSDNNDFTYSNGTLTTAESNLTKVACINIEDKAVEFKIVGNGDDQILEELFQNELLHLENLNSTEPVTRDLFLPTAIKDKNISITWKSNNERQMDSSGRIDKNPLDAAEVILYAEIRINNSLYLRSYRFNVTIETNADKFRNFAAQIHPTLSNYFAGIVSSGNKEAAENALYYLPIYDPNGTYHYTKNFIANRDDSSTFNWDGYNDIGLTEIWYEPITTYTYVSLYNSTGTNKESAVYLNTVTFNTFAQITVKGRFEGDSEIYESAINITINLGTNSGIFGLVFSELQGQIDKIDVLQNILDTRAKYGWGYERGDFYLTDSYMSFIVQYDMPDDDFSKELLYATDGGNKFLHDEEKQKYHIGINADNFPTIDSTAGIKVTVIYDSNGDGVIDDNDKINNNDYFSKSDMLTFKVPGIVKSGASGFSNLGVFLSAKYQVYKQAKDSAVAEGLDERIEKLPSYESQDLVSKDGFTIDGKNMLTFSADSQVHGTGAYILLYDAQKCSDLSFTVSTETDYSGVESDVYGLAELLACVTGNEAGNKIIREISFTSDGKDYLNESEVDAVKAYFVKYGKVSDAEWQSLWDSVSSPAPGYVLTNGSSIINILSTKLNTENMFKYLELLQWATDAVDWKEKDGTVSLKCPNMGVIGSADWRMNTSGNANDLDPSSDITKWTRTKYNSSYQNSKYHNDAFYDDDNTTYISSAEAQIILAFLLNNSSLSGNNTGSSADQFRAALSLPTLLHDDAVETLIAEIYRLEGAKVNNTSLKMSGDIPLVTNLDGIDLPILSFSSLTSFEAKGNALQPAFIQSTSISSFLNRLTSTENSLHSQLKSLTLQYCAVGNTTLNLSSIGQFTVLENFDISGNSGINNIANIIDLNMKTLKSINISGVNVSDEFLDFPLSYINLCTGDSCQVKYKNGATYTNDDTSKLLANLNRLSELRGNYLQLAQRVYDDDGIEHDVIWHIESGNTISRVDAAGNILEIPSEQDLLDITANYFYCDVGFTYNGQAFTPNRIYKLTCNNNGSATFTDIGFEILTSEPVLPTLDDEYVNNNVPSWKQNSSSYTPDANYTIEVENSGPTTSTSNIQGSQTSSYRYLYGVDSNGNATRINDKNNTYNYTLTYSSITTYTYTFNYKFNGTGSYNEEYFSTNTIERYVLTGGVLNRFNYNITNNKTASAEWSLTTNITVSANVYAISSIAYQSGFWGMNTTTLDKTSYNTYDYIYFQDASGNRSVYFYLKAPMADDVRPADPNPLDSDNLKNFVWTYDSAKLSDSYKWDSTSSSYASYVATFSTDSSKYTHIESIVNCVQSAVGGITYFRYTGTSGTYTPYIDGTAGTAFTYRNNNIYRLLINNGRMSYTTGTLSGVSAGGTSTSMDQILKNANAVLNTTDEIEYYGNYYYYTGDSFITDNSNEYISGKVYRLLKNESGQFYFALQGDCSSVTSSTGNGTNGSGTGLLTDLANFSDSDVGKIYYLNNSNSSDTTFKGGDFYSVIYNELSGIYYLKTFNNVSFSAPTGGTNQRIQNDRPFEGENGSAYGGTGGTYYVTMSATIIINNVPYTRMFNVSVFGG